MVGKNFHIFLFIFEIYLKLKKTVPFLEGQFAQLIIFY